MESSIKREKATTPQLMCSVGLVRGCKCCFREPTARFQPTSVERTKKGKIKYGIQSTVNQRSITSCLFGMSPAKLPDVLHSIIVITTFYYFPWVRINRIKILVMKLVQSPHKKHELVVSSSYWNFFQEPPQSCDLCTWSSNLNEIQQWSLNLYRNQE